MNSRADPGDGYFQLPLENQTQREFQFRGSWIPFTPKKPVHGRSSLIGDERVIHQDLNGVPGGEFEERGFCNSGAVHDLNYAVQGTGQYGVYDHGAHQGVTNINRMINNVEGSYAQARSNCERDLLGRSDATSPLAPVIRNTTGNVDPVSGKFTSDVGMVTGSFNQSGNSQAGYTEFELDDLLNPDQMPFSFTSLLSGGDSLFQVRQCE